jgi:POT family proton-dependent oligopeptide transporter
VAIARRRYLQTAAIGAMTSSTKGSANVSSSESQSVVRADKAFLGHPAGLGWLSATEFWERFSYYGMLTLLALYMTQQLLLPGHVENIIGFPVFRRFVEGLYGAHSPQALAAGIVGLYSGLVYVTPLAGGYLADRFIGRTMAITVGAALMALGHFLMAFDVSFLLALLCLLIGVGFFKGNIASQVGDLYPPGDLRRADAFQIYLFGIQIAVILSPLVCGTLGQKVAWHWGFGAAGVGMLIGLATYLFGRPWLPKEPPRDRAAREDRQPLTREQWTSVIVLIAILPILAVAIVGNQEIFNAYIVWANDAFQLTFFGFSMPITWIVSFDSFISAATILLSVAFWRWWATRRKEPDEITKVTIGVIISALGPLMLAGAAATIAATGHRANLGWAIGFHLLNDIGFANVLPVGLALYTRASPKQITGVMIGVYYLHLFAGNVLTGWLAGQLEKMPATTFWLMHAGLMAAAAAVLLLVRNVAGRSLAPGIDLATAAQAAE